LFLHSIFEWLGCELLFSLLLLLVLVESAASVNTVFMRAVACDRTNEDCKIRRKIAIARRTLVSPPGAMALAAASVIFLNSVE